MKPLQTQKVFLPSMGRTQEATHARYSAESATLHVIVNDDWRDQTGGYASRQGEYCEIRILQSEALATSLGLPKKDDTLAVGAITWRVERTRHADVCVIAECYRSERLKKLTP